MKTLLISSLLIGFFFTEKAMANRYESEISLVEKNTSDFINISQKRYDELSEFTAIWKQIEENVKLLRQTLDMRLDKPREELDETSKELQELTNEKSYVENSLAKLFVLRPKIEAAIQKADNYLVDYTEMQEVSQTNTSSLLKEFSNLQSSLEDRKVAVDLNLELWQKWQFEIAQEAMVKNNQVVMDHLEVLDALNKINQTFSIMSINFYLALKNHDYVDAENILDGVVWLKSVFPLYFTDKITTKEQFDSLKQIKDEAEVLQAEMIAALARHAHRGLGKVVLQSEVHSFGGKMRNIAYIRGRGGESADDDEDEGDDGDYDDYDNYDYDFDDDSEVENESINIDIVKNMDPGTVAKENKVRLVYDADHNITVVESLTYTKSVCEYKDGQEKASAKVDVDGVARIENGHVAESAKVYSELTLMDKINQEVKKDIHDKFKKEFVVECNLKRDFSNTAEDNHSPNESGKRLKGETENLRDLVNNAAQKSKSEAEKNDLEKLNKTISNFLNVQSNFGKVLEDKTKELARSQANTVNQTNNLPAQTAKVPKGQRPLPPSGANASSKLNRLSNALMNLLGGFGSSLSSSLNSFLGNLANNSQRKGASYATAALANSLGVSKEQKPIEPVREKLMNVARGFFAPGVKIQYTQIEDKRGGPNSFDCSGFVAYAYNQVGLKLINIYGGVPTVKQIIASNGPFHKIDSSEARAGDLIVHLGEGDKHVGIYTRDEQGNVKEISATVGGKFERSKLDPSHPKFKSSITEYSPSEFGKDWTVYRWNK